MQQLSLFAQSSDSSTHAPKITHVWKLFTDGASRKNPGPAGAGIFILKDSVVHTAQGFFLGTKTNNQAEYLALILGLLLLKKHASPEDKIHIIADSELLVKQLNGMYRVKHPELKPLHTCALSLITQLKGTVCHVLRHENTHADEMANEGIDKKIAVPLDILAVLAAHDITL